MSNCRSGCKTQDHASYGDCLQDSNISFGNEKTISVLKHNEKELNAYRDARKLGIQPASTKMKDINKAVRMSDKAGKALQA